MKLTSSAFQNNGQLPAKYSCDGEGINPPLEIGETPQNAKSLVLICDDPDAPSGTFIHWLIWNINPQERLILERSVPQGSIQGLTSTGKPGYIGPCPPSGTHRYIFKIYALDCELDLPQNSNKKQIEQAIQNHLIDQAELLGLYSRQ